MAKPHRPPYAAKLLYHADITLSTVFLLKFKFKFDII